jgi:twinkle protein
MANIKELDSKIQEQIFHLQKFGQPSGLHIGFPSLDKLYSIKEKRTTIIYGRPTDGKSQFLMQTLCALACTHGKKSVIYTPETGDTHEIYAEIIHCLTGKSFNLNSINYRINEMELYNVIPFVKDYFKVVELDEKEFSLDNWLEITEEAIKDFGIFSSAADNWNDLDHTSEAMISEYLKRNLVKWNRHAKKHNYHGFVVAHARNPNMVKGDEFPKPARVDEIDGGYAWYAKAMNMILVHREYEEHAEGWKQSNTAEIHIKKLKKRSEGQKGITRLTFDTYRNAYYENHGDLIYLKTPFNGSFFQSKNDIQPSIAPF